MLRYQNAEDSEKTTQKKDSKYQISLFAPVASYYTLLNCNHPIKSIIEYTILNAR